MFHVAMGPPDSQAFAGACFLFAVEQIFLLLLLESPDRP